MRAKLSDIIALFPPELSAVGARDRTGPAVLFVGQGFRESDPAPNDAPAHGGTPWCRTVGYHRRREPV
jgi:hypothetical protein